MLPQRLDSTVAYDIAKAMMDGFNRHYRLFRTESARAKHRFETADWHGSRVRRVHKAPADLLDPAFWPHYAPQQTFRAGTPA